MSNDTVQRFIFEEAAIRGEIVHLQQSFATILEQHQYPPQVRHLLGESLVAAILLTSIIKFKGQLTIQFQSDGPIKMLVAKCNNNFHIRGLVQFDAKALPDALIKGLEQGKLIVTIQADNTVKPYQSIIPLEKHSICACLEHYFAQSEQLATRLWIAVDGTQAAGMLLQLMPDQPTQEREQFWEHAVKLGETITPQELLQLPNTDTLHRLYHQNDIRLFESEPVSFRCTCSREKMQDAIKTLGYQEAMAEISGKQQLSVTCEFCNKHYAFDKVDIELLFH